jgi:hypothetical protein
MKELTNLRALFEAFGDEVVQLAKENLERPRTIRGKKARRVASGNLKNDLTYTFWKRGKKDVLIFTTRKKETREYADVIEQGRKPYPNNPAKTPPLKPIMNWLRIKGIALRGSNGRFIERNEDNYRVVARLVARSIRIRGIQGIYYFKEAFEKTFDEFDPQILNAAIADFEFRLKANKYIK